MRKINSRLLWASSFIGMVASGCSYVQIKDQEWCGDMGAKGAYCFHTLNPAERAIDKEHWDAERFGQICTGPQGVADIKAAIEKLCGETGDCVYEKQLQLFFKNIQALPQ